VRKMFRGRKAQTTAEYAIMIAVVITAAIAMQVYIKRSLQGGIKFVVDKSTDKTLQYEPYYQQSYSRIETFDYTDTEELKRGGEVERKFGGGNETGAKRIRRERAETIKAAQ